MNFSAALASAGLEGKEASEGGDGGAAVSVMELVVDSESGMPRLRGVGSIYVDGGCFCMERVGAHLVVGADEEVVLLRWLKESEKRHPGTVGKGGLCVVGRTKTPSRCAVTGLACREVEVEGGEGGEEEKKKTKKKRKTIQIAAAELLHSVVVYEYTEEDEMAGLKIAAMLSGDSFLATSMLFGGEEEWLYCAIQNGDKVVVWKLEENEEKKGGGGGRGGGGGEDGGREGIQLQQQRNRLPAAFARNSLNLASTLPLKLRQVASLAGTFSSTGEKTAVLARAGGKGGDVFVIGEGGGVARVVKRREGKRE